MREELRAYVESLFAQVPQTGRITEFKEELLSNLTEKYNDLLAQGRSEEEAYTLAISNIGDVNELLKGLENDKIYNNAHKDAERKRSAALVSAAVALYIIAIGVAALFSFLPGVQPGLGFALMFFIAAIATAMLVYNALTRPKYRKADDTMVEEFKEWKHTSAENHQMYKSITSSMWPLIVAAYFFIGFFFGGWAYTWLIFLIGAALQNILKIAFGVRRKK
jgi:hypothetical protein